MEELLATGAGAAESRQAPIQKICWRVELDESRRGLRPEYLSAV